MAVPLKRQWSAPARLILESCITKASSLSKQVDSLAAKVISGRSGSLPNLSQDYTSTELVRIVLDSVLDSVVLSTAKMPRTGQCHHCHRQLAHPEHVGVMPGIDQCKLGHYDLCPGGRETTPSVYKNSH